MSDLASLQEIAALLGGHVDGDRVLCPGPNHSSGDRSLVVTPARNANGFKVRSFALDDPSDLRLVHQGAARRRPRRARRVTGAKPRLTKDKQRAERIARAHGDLGRVRLADRHAGRIVPLGKPSSRLAGGRRGRSRSASSSMLVVGRTDEEALSDTRHGRRDARHPNRRDRRRPADPARSRRARRRSRRSEARSAHVGPPPARRSSSIADDTVSAG